MRRTGNPSPKSASHKIRRISRFSSTSACAIIRQRCGRPFPLEFPCPDRLQCSLQAIDAANARDPTHDAGEPAEFHLWSAKMSEALAAFAPGATEPLRIAVRGQHIERWLSPRRALSRRQGWLFRLAQRRQETPRGTPRPDHGGLRLRRGGDRSRCRRSLARKEQLRNDAEAQTLEDVACLVFLRYYAENFAAKHAREKVFDILLKTQRINVAARPRWSDWISASPRRFSHSTSRGCGCSKPHRPLERLRFRWFSGERPKGESERCAWAKA